MGLTARVVRVMLLAAAATMALVPAGHAQFSSAPPLQLEIEPFDARVAPIIGNGEVIWTATYSCDVVFRSTPEPILIAIEIGPVDPWVRANSLPPALTALPSLRNCPLGETRSVSGVLEVRLTREAPAYEPTSIPLRATMQVKDESFEADANTTVVPDFYSFLAASFDQAFMSLEPNEERLLTLHVENFGNARVVVRVAADGPVAEFAATFPNETALDSPYGGGGNRTATDLEVRVRGPNDDELYARAPAALTFRLTAFSAQEPEVEGDTAMLSLAISVRGHGGIDEALSAPGIAGVAVAAALVLLLRRLDWSRR